MLHLNSLKSFAVLHHTEYYGLTSLPLFLDLIIQSRFCVRQTWDKSNLLIMSCFSSKRWHDNCIYLFEVIKKYIWRKEWSIKKLFLVWKME
jgi:hypothetical protein